MNKDNIIKRYVKLFNFCKDANIVVYFHKKASDAIWKNWLYIAIPVIIFAINLFFMIKANVLWGQGNSGKMTLSYLRDLSNSTAYHIQGTNASTMLCLYQSTEKELCMEN